MGAHAANLVPNPDFDTDTSSWAANPDSLGVSFTLDATDGSPAAPSALLTPGGGINDVDSACFAATPGQYDLFVNLKPGNNGPGASSFVVAYSDTACTAYITGLANTSQTDVPLADGWFQQSTQNFALPVGTQSVYVVLGTVGSVPIHFDHVRFGPAGTTPVTLQSFDLD